MADLDQQLTTAFESAGVRGALHAHDLLAGEEVCYGSDRPQHLASVGKIPILVTLMQSVAQGEHQLEERVRIPAATPNPAGHDRGSTARTAGPTGLSTMIHPVELSLQDLARMMIVVSDNHATDVILEMVPPARVTATMQSLGLQQTVFEHTIDEMFALLQAHYGGVTDEAERRALTRAHPLLQGETATWRSTPRDVTKLLALIWNDQAAPPALCAAMREILYQQVWPHRLSSGFPDGVRIGAKTGTLTGIRNECGVVEYPDGGRYAVAVFTRTDDYSFRNPAADRVIGTAGRLAVDHLRERSSQAVK